MAGAHLHQRWPVSRLVILFLSDSSAFYKINPCWYWTRCRQHCFSLRKTGVQDSCTPFCLACLSFQLPCRMISFILMPSIAFVFLFPFFWVHCPEQKTQWVPWESAGSFLRNQWSCSDATESHRIQALQNEVEVWMCAAQQSSLFITWFAYMARRRFSPSFHSKVFCLSMAILFLVSPSLSCPNVD